VPEADRTAHATVHVASWRVEVVAEKNRETLIHGRTPTVWRCGRWWTAWRRAWLRPI